MTLVIMTENGPVDEALLDGYGFGDRLLEGVMFRIIILEGKINCPGLHADSQAYADRYTLEQVAKWQLDAEENCCSLGDNLQTPEGEDAWIEIVEADPQDPLSDVRGTVRSIEAESFGDISKRILGTLKPR